MDRLYPPALRLERSDFSDIGIRLTPATEVWEWLQAEILVDNGSIHNEEHAHLIDADIRVMWASAAFTKKEHTVVGQAEQVASSVFNSEVLIGMRRELRPHPVAVHRPGAGHLAVGSLGQLFQF